SAQRPVGKNVALTPRASKTSSSPGTNSVPQSTLNVSATSRSATGTAYTGSCMRSGRGRAGAATGTASSPASNRHAAASNTAASTSVNALPSRAACTVRNTTRPIGRIPPPRAYDAAAAAYTRGTAHSRHPLARGGQPRFQRRGQRRAVRLQRAARRQGGQEAPAVRALVHTHVGDDHRPFVRLRANQAPETLPELHNGARQ